jgi:hypothetical protein
VDYRWSYPGSPEDRFADQAEAEEWLGSAWSELREQGIDEVTLMHGDEVVYGPMSLHPPE